MFTRQREQVKAWWAKRQARAKAAFDGGQIAPPSHTAIDDGVTYSQPPIVPHWVKRDGANVAQYLEDWASTDQRHTYRFQFDGNRSATYDGRIDMPIDDPLCEWDWTTRKDVLTNCHAAYQRNPLAKAAVNLTRLFVVGKGHTVTAQNKDVQKVLDDFRANPENYVFGYDRAFIQDLQVDGELFVRFFVEDGQVIIAQTPPWYVRKANTAPGFLRRVLSWSLEYPDELGASIQEDVPGADMLHVAINNHGYELRGRPDLFVVLPWLRAYNEWITDRARQNKWRNALLWLVSVASKVPGAVAKVRAVWAQPPTPGSVAVVPDTVTVQTLNNPVGAGDAAEDGRQIKLQVIAGVNLPEYMLADGENANLASATAQQLPALWKFTDGQQLLIEQVWTPIYKRVIQAAIDAGLLPEMVEVQDLDGDPVERTEQPDQAAQLPPEPGQLPEPPKKQKVDPILAVDSFTVAYYELQADDPKTLADAFSMLVTNRISSVETAREKIGLNHMIEEKRLQREEAAARDRAMMGMNTDLSGEPMGDPDDEENANNEDQPAKSDDEQAQQKRNGQRVTNER